MHMNCYTILGLFCLIILSSKSQSQSTTTGPEFSHTDDYNDDYSDLDNYPDYSDISNTTESDEPFDSGEILLRFSEENRKSESTSSGQQSTVSNEKLPPSNIRLLQTEISEAITAYECPAKCDCTDGTSFINCAARNLTKLPNNLPQDAIKIDFSFNQLELFNVDDLVNCSQIRDVIMSGNRIKAIINFHEFKQLHHLDHIDLSSNEIELIDASTFSAAEALTHLNLNNNPIVIPETGPFLNLPELEILSLEDCNISKLYEETFRNLTGLTALYLFNNSIDSAINVPAFEPLTKLQQLRIPSVSDESLMHDLCMVLTGIDEITTNGHFVSCFELVSGSTYEDSTGTIPPENTTPILKVNRLLINETTIVPLASTMIFNSSETNATQIVQNSTQLDEITKEPNSTFSTTPEPLTNLTSSPVSTVTEPSKKDDHRVNVSSQSIHNILIGIIATAIAGLIFGVFFRKNVCGIKTFLCGAEHTAVPQTDNEPVRTPEEFPLHKISN